MRNEPTLNIISDEMMDFYRETRVVNKIPMSVDELHIFYNRGFRDFCRYRGDWFIRVASNNLPYLSKEGSLIPLSTLAEVEAKKYVVGSYS